MKKPMWEIWRKKSWPCLPPSNKIQKGSMNASNNMKNNSLRVLLSLALAWSALPARQSFAADRPKRAFGFGDLDYFHRWSKNELHEFTPEKQEDLNKWSDMITINGYPGVSDGDGLAAAANAVLENYKKAQARVVKTSSVPLISDQP